MRLNKILPALLVAAGLAGFWGAPRASAQDVAIKTNLISDIALSPNIGVEVGLAPKWTLDMTFQGNFWTVDDRKWKHAFFQPEVRYWFCHRFAGHFVGLNLIGGTFNAGNLRLPDFLGSNFSNLRHQRYQGWGAGAGIAYGYAWPVHKHWNIEAEIGIGWIYTRYDSYPCAKCGNKIEDNRVHNYVGPTKLAVTVEYIF